MRKSSRLAIARRKTRSVGHEFAVPAARNGDRRDRLHATPEAITYRLRETDDMRRTNRSSLFRTATISFAAAVVAIVYGMEHRADPVAVYWSSIVAPRALIVVLLRAIFVAFSGLDKREE